MTLLPVPFQQPQMQQPKPQVNIADMIKNFDKNKKERFDFQQRPVEQFLDAAQQVYRQDKDDQHRLSELSETQP